MNRARGEVPVRIGGAERPMRLTLGGLAALEARLGAGGLVALAERFEAGGFAASDLVALLAEGLRGAGESVGDDEVAAMDFDGGAAGAAEAACRLLEAAFRGRA